MLQEDFHSDFKICGPVYLLSMCIQNELFSLSEVYNTRIRWNQSSFEHLIITHTNAQLQFQLPK